MCQSAKFHGRTVYIKECTFYLPLYPHFQSLTIIYLLTSFPNILYEFIQYNVIANVIANKTIEVA